MKLSWCWCLFSGTWCCSC